MASCIILCLVCLVLSFSFIYGQQNEEDIACRREHGTCTRHVYENTRLVALRSSGCQRFCQCAHASTELDGSVTYKWVQHTCPPTTLFDDSLPAPVCNHAKYVQCHDVDGEDCRSEHGACTRFMYENVRLFALTSSGCKKFCQCVHASTELDGSVTYQWTEHTCPAQTLFDSSIRVCNFADRVQCDGNPGQNALTTTSWPWVQEATPIVTDETSNECFEQYGYCTRDQYENVRLVALRSSGCKNYYQCAYASTKHDGSVTYKWVKKTCPPTTLFDESLPAPVCNYDYKVQCPDSDEESEDCTTEYGTCTQYMYETIRLVPKRSSGCEKFCQCAHASTKLDGSVTYKWVEHDCPEGLLFDKNIRVCNYPANVECSAGNQERKRILEIFRQLVSPQDDDEDCFQEYGTCTKSQYEDVRLLALRSSGCKNFCQCAHASTKLDGSVTYKWVKQTCPEKTLFDQDLDTPVCNHEGEVRCPSVIAVDDGCSKEHGNPGQNALTTTSRPWVHETTPIVADEASKDCLAEYGYCTRDQYENVRLVALRSSGCKNFYQCAPASTELDGSVTYKWVKKTCPSNTLFDESLPTPVCNHNYEVQCPDFDEENEDCTTQYGTCTQYMYENVRLVPKRSSGCKKFCQCAHASTEQDGSVTYKWVEHDCPEGLLFDKNIRVCNYAANVECSGYQERKRILEILRQLISPQGDDEDCFQEYGTCTQSQYENVRLLALRSSGCKNFCQCTRASTQLDGSVTYKWVKQTCPEETLFDQDLDTPVCNHEAKVRCPSVIAVEDGCSKEHGNPGQNAVTTTLRPWEQETTPVSTDEASNECFAEYGFCTRDQYENVRLVALRSSGCKNFYQCAPASTKLDGSVTYKWVKKTCPPSTLFDESLPTPVCNHDYEVQCPDSDEENEDCTTQYGTCTQYMYENVRLVPKRSSGCKKFCQCAHASTKQDGSVTYKWVEHDCPEGLLFDKNIRVCNYAANVECNGYQERKRILEILRQLVFPQGDDEDCFQEYGTCTQSQYENVRLVALRSSGCKNFCHCAHASTQLNGSVTYKWVKQTCPEKTLFDQDLDTPVCNHEAKVRCPSVIAVEDGCSREHGISLFGRLSKIYQPVQTYPSN